MRIAYRRADHVVAVSAGVARDVELRLGLLQQSVRVIYNAAIRPQNAQRHAGPPAHQWLDDGGPPLLLAVGSLRAAKNHRSLLEAFAKLRRRRAARLIILGEGPLRAELEQLARELGITDHVAMPGFASDPWPYFHAASALVSSSRFEGLPTAPIEALSCGCPVVATDCPGGTAEIVRPGREGLLVPVDDSSALAVALDEALEGRWDRASLIDRAASFSIDRAVAGFLSIMSSMSATDEGCATNDDVLRQERPFEQEGCRDAPREATWPRV